MFSFPMLSQCVGISTSPGGLCYAETILKAYAISQGPEKMEELIEFENWCDRLGRRYLAMRLERTLPLFERGTEEQEQEVRKAFLEGAVKEKDLLMLKRFLLELNGIQRSQYYDEKTSVDKEGISSDFTEGDAWSWKDLEKESEAYRWAQLRALSSETSLSSEGLEKQLKAIEYFKTKLVFEGVLLVDFTKRAAHSLLICYDPEEKVRPWTFVDANDEFAHYRKYSTTGDLVWAIFEAAEPLKALGFDGRLSMCFQSITPCEDRMLRQLQIALAHPGAKLLQGRLAKCQDLNRVESCIRAYSAQAERYQEKLLDIWGEYQNTGGIAHDRPARKEAFDDFAEQIESINPSDYDSMDRMNVLRDQFIAAVKAAHLEERKSKSAFMQVAVQFFNTESRLAAAAEAVQAIKR